MHGILTRTLSVFQRFLVRSSKIAVKNATAATREPKVGRIFLPLILLFIRSPSTPCIAIYKMIQSRETKLNIDRSKLDKTCIYIRVTRTKLYVSKVPWGKSVASFSRRMAPTFTWTENWISSSIARYRRVFSDRSLRVARVCLWSCVASMHFLADLESGPG